MLSMVVLTALVGGLLPAVVAAVLSGLLLNYLFVEPVGTLTISDPENALAIVVFLLVGVAVASVVDRAGPPTAEATRARAEANTPGRARPQPDAHRGGRAGSAREGLRGLRHGRCRRWSRTVARESGGRGRAR